MNKAFLVGHLTKDPELKYTGSNVAVATFTIAVNRTYANETGEHEADFINIVVWRKQAENAKKYCKKGSLVGIDGSIQTRTYDDKEGKKTYVTEVVANNVQFLGSKAQATQDVQAVTQSTIPDEPFADFGETVELSEDDIAF